MNRFVVWSLCLLLAACGFQPKGRLAALPPYAWQVSGADGLHDALAQALRHAGSRQAATAERELRIVSADGRKDIYTITRAAKLNEYLLSLEVVAQAYRHGQAWGEPMRVRVERTLPYVDAMVLGKQEEEAVIWQEMHADAASQLVRRLAFLPE